MSANQDQTTTPATPVQISQQTAIAGIPGGVQLAAFETRPDAHTSDDGGDGPPPTDSRQGALPLTGVRPGARWCRDSSDVPPRSWAQLDLELDGIYLRRGRASAWREDLSAVATMEHVRAQTFSAAEIYGVLGLPDWARGRSFDEWGINANEREVLGALWIAYERGAGGIFDVLSTIASDLGMSERTLRYILNGRTRHGVLERPGLVARGLVARRQCYKQGHEGRPSDHTWLLLRIGPVFEQLARPLVFAGRNTRPPRRSGFTRTDARRALVAARTEARAMRHGGAGVAWSRRPRRDRGGAVAVSPIDVDELVPPAASVRPRTSASTSAPAGSPSEGGAPAPTSALERGALSPAIAGAAPGTDLPIGRQQLPTTPPPSPFETGRKGRGYGTRPGDKPPIPHEGGCSLRSLSPVGAAPAIAGDNAPRSSADVGAGAPPSEGEPAGADVDADVRGRTDAAGGTSSSTSIGESAHRTPRSDALASLQRSLVGMGDSPTAALLRKLLGPLAVVLLLLHGVACFGESQPVGDGPEDSSSSSASSSSSSSTSTGVSSDSAGSGSSSSTSASSSPTSSSDSESSSSASSSDGGPGSSTADTSSSSSSTGPTCGGLYEPCEATADCCVGSPTGVCVGAAGWCSFECESAIECDAPHAGDAVPSCVNASCVLSCANGETCPPGFECMDVPIWGVVCW